MGKVLIIDTLFKQNLAAVRSLGKKKIDVVVLNHTHFCAGTFSIYSKNSILCPDYRKSKERFTKFVLNHLKTNKYDTVFPFSENIIQIFYENREEFSKYANILFSPQSSFDIASDKLKTMMFAQSLGIPIPKTYKITSFESLKKEIDKINCPIILKLSKSSGSRGVKIIKNRDELIEKYIELKKLDGGDLFYQDYLPREGPGWGFCGLCKNGKVLASFIYKRLLEFPSDGGPSALRVSAKNEFIKKMSFKLLKKLKWEGVIHLEFKEDLRDNIIKLLEINPRFWGSLQTAISCGVDFPYLLYKMCIGEKFEQVHNYQTNALGRDSILVFGNIISSKIRFRKAIKIFSEKAYEDIFIREDIIGSIGYLSTAVKHIFDFDLIKFVLIRKK